MKLSTLMLAGLVTMTSVAAFAEDGAERSKEFYNNFSFIQEKLHGTTEQTVSAETRTVKSAAAEPTNDMQQPSS